jgi:hypothetical protein
MQKTTTTTTTTQQRNTMSYIRKIKERHDTQLKVNKHLSPRPNDNLLNGLKLTTWEFVLTAYAADFTLRKSEAFSEWFACQWHTHNLELIEQVFLIITPIDFENYGLYQRMKFSKIYPNETVLESSKRQYYGAVKMEVAA